MTARVAELEQLITRNNASGAGTLNPLVAEEETINRARLDALANARTPKGAVALPAVIKGFKSDPHTIGE